MAQILPAMIDDTTRVKQLIGNSKRHGESPNGLWRLLVAERQDSLASSEAIYKYRKTMACRGIGKPTALLMRRSKGHCRFEAYLASQI